MDRLTSLFFPDTVMVPTAMTQALLFFEKIYHYLPAERSLADGGEYQPLYDENLCYGYAPTPLGTDLERFNRVIKDMKTNRSDYGERLRHLSAAALTAGETADSHEATVGSITATILAKEIPVEKPDELWNARIVLKLAEDLDIEEKKITADLAQLDHDEKEIFSLLKGAEKKGLQKDAPLTDRHESPPAPSQTMIRRLQAWTRLFLADLQNNQPQAPNILTTDKGDIIDLIVEKYSELRGGYEPALLLSLPLPTLESYSTPDFIQKRSSFRKEAHAILKELQKILTGSVTNLRSGGTSGDDAGSVAPETIATWEKTLTNHFPSGDPAGSQLHFYNMEGISLSELLTHILLKNIPPTPRSKNNSNGLLAHIS